MAASRNRLNGARIVLGPIFTDPLYLASLKARAICGTLSPAMETSCWHYLYGKPVEEVHVTSDDEDYTTWSYGDIMKKIAELQVVVTKAIDDENQQTPLSTVQ